LGFWCCGSGSTFFLLLSMFLSTATASPVPSGKDVQAYNSYDSSTRLISPVGSVVRSVIIPGWGQIHAQNYVSGSFSFLGTTGLLVGGLVSHRSFRQIYDKEYAPVAKVNSKSPAALSIYGRVNQVYKIRQFFLLTAAGVWAYSIVDSYVAANLRNARSKSQVLLRDVVKIEKLSLEIKPNRISFRTRLEF